MSSVNGNIAYPGLSAYSATKFALEGFGDALRMELGPRLGIRVITVKPGDHARVTSIMSLHKHHAQEMWHNMPKEQQELEEIDFQKFHAAALRHYGLTSPTSWKGSPLLQDIKEAVLSKHPSSIYISTSFTCKILYRLITLFPHWFTDFVLIKMGQQMINSTDNFKETLDF